VLADRVLLPPKFAAWAGTGKFELKLPCGTEQVVDSEPKSWRFAYVHLGVEDQLVAAVQDSCGGGTECQACKCQQLTGLPTASGT
jgi:hypothetical protein